jgi:hypothetical protein
MVITSDFFTGLEKQKTQAHGHKAQHKHRWQPNRKIHKDTPSSGFLWHAHPSAPVNPPSNKPP